jgi:ubiquinone/menaquinone biosynthesis C-methylase UbiE
MGKFPAPPRLAEMMTTAGLRQVRYRLLMLGSVAVHAGIKPLPDDRRQTTDDGR